MPAVRWGCASRSSYSIRSLPCVRALRLQSGYFGIRNNDDWIDEILASLDLAAKAGYEHAYAVRAGWKRRVLVAQALVHRPPVIVLDEPTAGWTWSSLRGCGSSCASSTAMVPHHRAYHSLPPRRSRDALWPHPRCQGRACRGVDSPPICSSASPRTSCEWGWRAPPARPALAVMPNRGLAGVRRSERFDEVEGLLARLRTAGLRLPEMPGEPDLERVFIGVMHAA